MFRPWQWILTIWHFPFDYVHRPGGHSWRIDFAKHRDIGYPHAQNDDANHPVPYIDRAVEHTSTSRNNGLRVYCQYLNADQTYVPDDAAGGC